MNTKDYDAIARRVEMVMSLSQLNNYRPHRSGIRVGVHDYNKVEKLADLTIFGATKTGTPEDDIEITDINTELAILEKRHQLSSDRVRTKPLMPFRNNFLVQTKAVLSTPYYQGQNDRMKSRADNIQTKMIPKEEFNTMANHYLKEATKKQFDGKYKVEHEGEVKDSNGQKFVKVRTGDIIRA